MTGDADMTDTRSRIAVALSATLLAACGGGGGGGTPAPVVTAPPPPPVSSAPGLLFREVASARGLEHASGFSADYKGMPSLFAGGAAVGDVDGDGDLDLFILRGDARPNMLMLNNGEGGFTDATPAALALPGPDSTNLKLSGPLLADLDGDGALDLFAGGLAGDPSLVFRGDGRGGFTRVSTALDSLTSANTVSASLGDYDGDGDPDLALAHWGTPRNGSTDTETLWRNDGGFVFTSASDASGLSAALNTTADGKLGTGFDYSFAPNFADINRDGDLDLLLVSDFGATQVFQSEGDGTFTDVTDPTQITDSNGMGTDVGDVNGDGTPDWFVSSINGNRLYRSVDGTLIGQGSRGLEAGAWGWGSCMADFDLDGDLDIYQTNGWVEDAGASPQEPYTADRSRLWLNDGSANYTDVADAAGLRDEVQGRAVVCADFDGDLDTDILLLVNGSETGALLWENRIAGADALSVRVDGPDGGEALGAKLTLSTAAGTQTRWVRAGTTFTAQTPPWHVFGTEGTAVNDLRVDWPDGQTVTVNDIAPGDRLRIGYPD